MVKPWQLLSSELAHNFRIFDLRYEQRVSPRTEKTVQTIVLESPDWVNVIALTPAQDVVLIRQFRFGTQRVTLEIPGGLIDAGESALEAGQRELREETGYAAARWTALGSIAPNPAFMRNRLYTFLAEGCVLAGAQAQDPSEDIAVETTPLSSIPAMLASGAIDHALVAVAFQKLGLLRAGMTPA